jgi:D-alanyl-D-alanine carboxypeptidase
MSPPLAPPRRWIGIALLLVPLVLAAVLLLTAARVAVPPAAATPGLAPSTGPTGLEVPPPQVTILQPTASRTASLPATSQPRPSQVPTLPSPTVDPECALFHASLDLLLPPVNRASGLTRDFEPDDLESPALAYRNAYIVPIKVRAPVIPPLLKLLGAANEAGMKIMAVSGYRSYEEQAVAYEKWRELYPDRASTISAEPGHSEHQLGTSIDFSTPALQEQYGEVFHTDFFRLAEGRWLYDYSPQYGFTLSYPAWAEQVTGYQWEPWHFRYVGVELAQYLFAEQITLTEYLSRCAPAAGS